MRAILAVRSLFACVFITLSGITMKSSLFLVLATALCLVAPSHAQMWPAEQMLARVKGSTVFIRDKDGQVKETVDRAAIERSVNVLQRLAPAYDMPVPPLYVFPAKSPNAFATTTKTGKPVVAINTAMLRMAGNDEDYLAVVMGHELGHLKGRHTTEGADRAKAIGLLGLVLGAVVDANQAQHGRSTGGLGMQLGATGSQLVNAKFSRDQEREADQLGATAMAKAGFDPSMASRFWTLLPGGGSGTWFDSHPSNGERQQELASLAEQLRPVYQAARRDAGIQVAARPGYSTNGTIEGSSPSVAFVEATAPTPGAQTSCVGKSAGPREVFERQGRGRLEIVRVLGPHAQCQNASQPLLAEVKQFGPPDTPATPGFVQVAEPSSGAQTGCVSKSAGPREVFEDPGRGRLEIVRVLGLNAECQNPARPLLAEVKQFGPPEPPLASSQHTSSIAQRLRELKQLHDEGLITQSVYEGRQLEILNSR